MRQPSLFNFAPSDTMRNSGLTPSEERELVAFCLADDYPRSLTVERTGTTYSLKTEVGAATLYNRLRKSGLSLLFSENACHELRRRHQQRMAL